MVEFKRILCPIDLSESSLRPLAYATALAKSYESNLTVLHVTPTFNPMQVRSGSFSEPVQFVYPVSREQLIAETRAFMDTTGASALDATLAVEAGDPTAAIIDRTVSMPADLLVVGTHGRSGFDRLLLGSVAERVLHRAPCPVLAVPPHATPAKQGHVEFTRILCPMDFSPSALLAFGFALDLARQANGSVILLNVIEWLADEDPVAHARFDVTEYRQHLVDEAHQKLRAQLDGESRAGDEIEDVVVMGRAHRQILQMAEAKDASLIVMGAQGRGGIGLTLFGSATQQVVRGAVCPVMTVRG